jgi:hypothetical protein
VHEGTPFDTWLKKQHLYGYVIFPWN